MDAGHGAGDAGRTHVSPKRRTGWRARRALPIPRRSHDPGVESFDGTAFRRAVRTPDASAAVIELAAQPERGECPSAGPRARRDGSSGVTATARRLLDLDADPSIVDTALSSDPSLRPLVRATPGMRLPGDRRRVRAGRAGDPPDSRSACAPLGRSRVGSRRRAAHRSSGLSATSHVCSRPPSNWPRSALDGLGLTTAREATLRRGRGARRVRRALICREQRISRRRANGSWRCGASGRGRSRTSSMRALGDRDAFPVERSRRATRLRVARAAVHAPRRCATTPSAGVRVARLRRHASVEQPPRLA